MFRPSRRKLALSGGFLAISVALISGLSGCAPISNESPAGPAEALTLGYFDNVTHAPALVGIHEGLFTQALGDTTLETQVFNAGPAAIEALSAGAIDAAYIGPSPAINSYLRSKGTSLVVVSGATAGGAALVVRDGIDTPTDLLGSTLATPQLGNTQDVALRCWLADQGFVTNLDGTGDVTISPSENSDTLSLFKKGAIDGAWVPEPWASRLVLEAGGHVLLNEAELWPSGEFPTTLLVVSKDFFDLHPETVVSLVEANVAAIEWMAAHPADVQSVINDVLLADTGKALAPEVLASALSNVIFTWNPIAGALQTSLNHAVALNVVRDGSLQGFVQVRPLNEVLTRNGQPLVSDGGLG